MGGGNGGSQRLNTDLFPETTSVTVFTDKNGHLNSSFSGVAIKDRSISFFPFSFILLAFWGFLI